MYAVIKTGGKQYRVTQGERLDVELLHPKNSEPAADAVVSFSPVLLVDGETIWAEPAQLAGAQVTAKVVAEAKGPKVTGLTYKNKTNSTKRWGHRQHYSTIEITGITRES